MSKKYWIAPDEVLARARKLVIDNKMDNMACIYGVPRGGVPVALAMAGLCCGHVVERVEEANYIVDDIVDSGATRERYAAFAPEAKFLTLVDKTREPELHDYWIIFPWEDSKESNGDRGVTDNITRLLQYIGEDPTREGLLETPERVVKAWREWASGYDVDIPGLFKTFEAGNTDEMVIVHNIPVVSKCEHHLADITGVAHVGYIPSGRIVGLSKIARLVDAFARRLQVQERLTGQIADAMAEHLSPLGVGVLVRAEHGCMKTRGVRVHGSLTTTSAMRGALLEKPEARAEFLALCRDAEAAR